MQLKKTGGRKMPAILATVVIVLAAVFFLHFEPIVPAVPETPAAPVARPGPFTPLTLQTTIAPPVINETARGYLMLSTRSLLYKYKDRTLPFIFASPDAGPTFTITSVEVIPFPGFLPCRYLIKYHGRIGAVQPGKNSEFYMEETNDWPQPARDAVAWQY